MNFWAVVTEIKDKPVEVDAPYLTRKDARDIKKQLDMEIGDNDDPGWKHTVVKMHRFLTSSEADREMKRLCELGIKK